MPDRICVGRTAASIRTVTHLPVAQPPRTGRYAATCGPIAVSHHRRGRIAL